MITASFTAARDMPPVIGEGAVPVVLAAIPPVDRYVTGGCRGGDAFIGHWLYERYPDAEHVAILPANRSQVDPWWENICASVWIFQMPPSTTYADRNARLVAEGDMVFGFPAYLEDDPRSRRSGTWQTIRMARRAGKLGLWQCVQPPFEGRVESFPADLILAKERPK